MMYRNILLVLVPAVLCAAEIHAGEVSRSKDEDTGWTVVSLTQADMKVAVVPEAGCNLYSMVYQGTEFLRKPPTIKQLPGYGYGVPILYPTPNRVRDSKFEYEGKEYRFPANNGPNFLHGLVHSVPWEIVAVSTGPTYASVTCAYRFSPGTTAYELFPFEHTLKLTIRVESDNVSWKYTVDNAGGKKAIPMGIALHPYFRYLGKRSQTYLKVPATHWMEAVSLLPTGKLVPLNGTKYDARKPHSLQAYILDDVYYGMRPRMSVEIDYRDKGLSLSLQASEDFTHLVVYTPERPFFCVENQTCSTDAHNLYNQGLEKESHLLIVPPGGTQTGWVRYVVKRE